MLSATVQSLVAPTNALLKGLWLTMAGATLFFAFFAWAIIRHSSPELAHLFAGFPLVLAIGCGMATAGCSILLGLYFHSEAGLRALLQPQPSPVELARDPYGRFNIKVLRQLQRLSLEELRLVALRGPYFRIVLLRLVLAELVAVAGLVVAIGSGHGLLTLPFSGAALAVMALAWPNMQALLGRAQLFLVDGDLVQEAC